MPTLPSDLPDDNHGPLLDHDTFRQVVRDVACGHDAVTVLSALLHSGDAGLVTDATGLAVLLEGAQSRMAMALDGLREAANALQIEAPFPALAPG